MAQQAREYWIVYHAVHRRRNKPRRLRRDNDDRQDDNRGDGNHGHDFVRSAVARLGNGAGHRRRHAEVGQGTRAQYPSVRRRRSLLPHRQLAATAGSQKIPATGTRARPRQERPPRPRQDERDPPP
eukprot:Amastigsp_a684876_8.p2 type:complete len:126 gc:universal Amastigsp_a684876_8:760-383(-)